MGARSCLVSSCRINHFGINPVMGGRPPRDSKIRGVRAVRAGAFAHEIASALMLVVLLSLKTKNVEMVIIKYVISVSNVREGENGKIITIQPKWAIEE